MQKRKELSEETEQRIVDHNKLVDTNKAITKYYFLDQ